MIEMRSLLSKRFLPIVIAFAFLLTIGGGLATALYKQQTTAVRVSSLIEQRMHIARVLSTMKDAETGQRGYLLTGQTAYLNPYIEALKQVDERFAALEESLRGDATGTALVAELKRKSFIKLSEFQKTIDLMKAGNGKQALQIMQTNEGLNLMTQIRALAYELHDDSQTVLKVKQKEEYQFEQLLSGAIMIVVVFGLIALLAFIFTLRRANRLLIETADKKDLLEAQLRQSQKMEAVGQLTGGLAHDLNNMLMGVTGALDMIDRRGERGDYSKMGKHVALARSAADRAASLTNRLLAFSRKATLRPEVTDPTELVLDMIEMIQRSMGPHIVMRVNRCETSWSTLVDRSALENSILNLCLNSRDAMPHGGSIVIDIEAKTLDAQSANDRDLPSGEYISISVTDTGTGMDEETRARVFEPFFTTKPIGEGSGLGLSQVYGFAKQSQGQVRVHSKIGVGTTFRILLPRDLSDSIVGVTGPSIVTGSHDETILVVDDEEAIREIVAEALESFGYLVLKASNGEQAIDVIYSNAVIDLLLTDIAMPGLNGKQVAAAMEIGRPGVPIVFMTGFAPQTVCGEDGILGDSRHIITKPFKLDDLHAKLLQVMTQRESERCD